MKYEKQWEDSTEKKVHGLTLGDVLCRAESDFMIFVGPFQLSTFCEDHSVKCY